MTRMRYSILLGLYASLMIAVIIAAVVLPAALVVHIGSMWYLLALLGTLPFGMVAFMFL